MLTYPDNVVIPDREFRRNFTVIIDGREIAETTFNILSEPEYERRIYQHLVLIDRTMTGQWVLKRVSDLCRTRNRFVRIFNTSPIHNAITSPRYWHGATAGGASSVDIRFSPIDRFAGHPRFPSAGNIPDEVLFHELIHALMMLAGSFNGRDIPRFDMVDDFFAVMVANMYSSELGRPLRRSHANFAVMLPAEAARVPAQYAGLITQFGRRQPALLAGLAQIGSPFNPFRPAP